MGGTSSLEQGKTLQKKSWIIPCGLYRFVINSETVSSSDRSSYVSAALEPHLPFLAVRPTTREISVVQRKFIKIMKNHAH